jgi:hypothetical protein
MIVFLTHSSMELKVELAPPSRQCSATKGFFSDGLEEIDRQSHLHSRNFGADLGHGAESLQLPT